MEYFKKRLADLADKPGAYGLVQAVFSLFSNQPVAPTSLAIAAATSPNVITTNAAWVLVNGVLQKINAATVMPVLTGLVIPAGSRAVAVFQVDASGTRSVAFGPVVTTNAALQFPRILEDRVAFGCVIIENGTAGVFTGGTTPLDTALLLVSYVNLPHAFNPLSTL